MDKTTRVGDGKVRHHFRTVQEGDLPTRVCGVCKGVEYECADGSWLHWLTLTSSCPVPTADPTLPLGVGSADCLSVGAVGGSEGQEGGM